MTIADRPWLVHALVVAAMLPAAWAVTVWITGGVDARVAGIAIRAHGIAHPIAIAVILLVAWAARTCGFR